jgi:signal transduction histidine kinase
MAEGGVVAVPEQVASGIQGTAHLHTLKAPILDAEGRPRLVLGITEDITGRKRMETELKKSRESLAKAQALAGIGNWEWEIATGEVQWSDQMFRILGCEAAVSPSLKLIMQRTHRDDRPAFGRALRRLLAGREVPPMEFRAVLADGSPRFFHSLLEVERGADGQALRLRGTIQDVTERRNTEEAFRQAQKLESLGVLAGGIAHDFNNLLSAIGGNLELAQMNMRPEPDAAPFLVKIEKILKRASELTHQMLAYSGKGRLVVKKLNLNQVAEEMPHLLDVSISKRVALTYRFAPDLPLIEADGTQIQQVIMNLVTNASESIGDRDGTITLTTGTEYLAAPQEQVESHGWSLVAGLYVTLEVADTGCGMSPETRRRLFDPFFTTKFSGRGLGLSAMLGILKGHNAVRPGQRHRRRGPGAGPAGTAPGHGFGQHPAGGRRARYPGGDRGAAVCHGLQGGFRPGRPGGGGAVPGPSGGLLAGAHGSHHAAHGRPRGLPEAAGPGSGAEDRAVQRFQRDGCGQGLSLPQPFRLPAEALHLPDAEGRDAAGAGLKPPAG